MTAASSRRSVTTTSQPQEEEGSSDLMVRDGGWGVLTGGRDRGLLCTVWGRRDAVQVPWEEVGTLGYVGR